MYELKIFSSCLDAKDGELDGRTKFFERNFCHGDKIIKTTTMKYPYANILRLHQDKEASFINLVDVQEVIEWIDTKGKAHREE